MTSKSDDETDRFPEEELPPQKRELVRILRDPQRYVEEHGIDADVELKHNEAQAPEIAKLMGISDSSVRDYIGVLRNKYGYVIESKRGPRRGYVLEEDLSVEHPEVVEALRKDGLTNADFEERFDLTRYQVRRLLEELRDLGHRIEHHIVDGTSNEKLYYIPEDRDRTWNATPDSSSGGSKTFRFGLISDTHLGSEACQLRQLQDFYDRLEDRGISTVYHAGDLTDGWKVYEGHINEVVGNATGWGRLKDYTVERYPQRDGIDTLFIEGNHDRKYYRRAQIHLGQLIDNEREDLHYVGDCQATFVLQEGEADDGSDDLTLELLHPSGGKPYTAGYRAQTVYRERPVSERPSIGAVGHIHGKAWFYTHGVEAFYPGCWKGVTTYGKRKGHSVKIGGWVVEVTIEDGQIRNIDPDFIRYEPEDNTNRYTANDVAQLTSD